MFNPFRKAISNEPEQVRFWHKADLPACVHLCLLSGVKRINSGARLPAGYSVQI